MRRDNLQSSLVLQKLRVKSEMCGRIQNLTAYTVSVRCTKPKWRLVLYSSTRNPKGYGAEFLLRHRYESWQEFILQGLLDFHQSADMSFSV